MIITIDGPAGTGKTTVARQVAEKLGYEFFDTGAMYRAVTYWLLSKKIDMTDVHSLEILMKQFHFDIRSEKGDKKYFVDERDVTDVIRSSEITNQVSQIAAHRVVRKSLVVIQREFGNKKNAVFEGRDMGTVVFPKADRKFFLTARPPVRVERRYKEFKEKKISTNEADVMRELLERDHMDSTREISPLKQAEDAHLIDTSDMTIEQVIEHILSLIPKR